MVKVQEAENQIVIDYKGLRQEAQRYRSLVPAIDRRRLTGRTPELVAADGFFSAKNEAAAHEKGIKVSIPNRSTKSEAPPTRKSAGSKMGEMENRLRGQDQPAQEAARTQTIALQRDEMGMKRWVGFGVIADNLINIGKALAK